MKNLLNILLIILLMTACNGEREKKSPSGVIESYEYADKVVPIVDANNCRWFFFNTASRPFGMVNLSPDTEVNGDWGGGYHHNQDTVICFSHVHAWQLSALPVLPVTLTSKNKPEIFNDYKSHFSHDIEVAEAGYHSLFLTRYGISAELTSTMRVGFHRYKYPSGSQKAVILPLNGMLGTGLMSEGVLRQTGKRTVSGSMVNEPTSRRPKDAKVFFVIDFNSDISKVEKDETTGNYLVHFDKIKKDELLMKTAISYTSEENAAVNMREELLGWDFDAVVNDSKAEWNEMLGRIQVEGGTEEQQKRFYTDLYHSLQGRRVISDVNGAYPDNTGDIFRIGQIPLSNDGKPLFNHYNSDAFWGAQWTLNTLWGLAYPKMMDEFINSFLMMYEDGGLIPRGPAGGNYTYVMTGSSFTPFIVSAYQKGIRNYDVDLAYEGCVKNHLPGGMMDRAGYEHNTASGGGLRYYVKLGYVPWPIPEGRFGFHQDGGTVTCEFAYQDWTLAQFAKALGMTDDYAKFMKRSKYYANVYDKSTGWMRPKDVNGKWKTYFDPADQDGFNESNSYQSTWFVPHDIIGLASLMGGKEAASNKLNDLFEKAEEFDFAILKDKKTKKISSNGTGDLISKPVFTNSKGEIVYSKYSRNELQQMLPINYGNQPSMQTAFIFNYLDKPWLTQYWSRKVVNAVYEGVSPDKGYIGDEDQGLMGALAVLMKIGIFSMDGGTSTEPFYELGSPIFDKVTIKLDNEYYEGKEIVLDVKNNSPENVYIQSISINGNRVNDIQLKHKDLVKGCTIQLVMGNQPNTSIKGAVNH